MDRNRDLFWKLIEPEHIRARAFCRKLIGHREDGDDLYQDALVCALSGFAGLRRIESFRPWLYRIIINTFKNRFSRSRWKRMIPLTSEIADGAAGDNPAPRREARRRLEIAFRAVSPDDRALITLFELDGWPIDEIARLTGQSNGNIRVRLSRARDKMRRALIRYLRQPGSKSTSNPLLIEDKVCIVRKPVKD